MAEYINALQFEGGCALSCDDTNLFPTFQVHYEKSTEQHLVIGGIGRPKVVADPDEFKKFLEQVKPEKAKKARK